MQPLNPYPFARPFRVEDLPAKGAEMTVTATEAERAALAETLDIFAIASLKGEFVVMPWRKTGVKVTGVVEADVQQACVVTLEPVDEHVREPVEMTFLPGAQALDPGEEIEFDPNAPEEPEPLEDGRIDLGAIAAEHMALGLDPYPRAPGAEFVDHIEDPPGDDEPPSPFAGLKVLKGRTDG